MSFVLKVLEQDKYSLQKEVELKIRMLESLQSDFDYMKNQQVQLVQEQQQHLERIHSTALSELNGKVEQHIHSTYSLKTETNKHPPNIKTLNSHLKWQLQDSSPFINK